MLSIFLGVFLVALLALYYLMKSGKFTKKALPESPDYPYIIESSLLTAYEQSLCGTLTRVLENRYIVFAKVGLANILSTDPELPDPSQPMQQVVSGSFFRSLPLSHQYR